MQKPQYLNKFLTTRNLIFASIVAVVFVFLLLAILFIINKTNKRNEIREYKHLTIPPTAPYVPNQIIVKFRDGFIPIDLLDEEKKSHFFGPIGNVIDDIALTIKGEQTAEEKISMINSSFKAIGVESYSRIFINNSPLLKGFYVLHVREGISLTKLQSEIAKLDFLYSSEPNFISKISNIPNDPSYSSMGWIDKIGAPLAWDSTTGSDSLVVAVVDTGVDLAHPDLAQNIVTGYDFANDDSDPSDDVGHGTHVAGAIGAIGNNNLDVVGVNWKVKIMPIKVCATESCEEGAIARGIQYAADNGAKVINMSLGTSAPAIQQCATGTLYESVISYALSKNVTIVAAAGNDNRNAALGSPGSCPGVITVGATTSSDTRANFSNYGSAVTIAAPGVGILSTFWRGHDIAAPGYPVTCGDSTFGSASDGMGYCSGTSMASPIVAGAAALLLSVNPSLTPDQVKNCLVQNGDPITTDQLIGGVRLNIYKAIQACSSGVVPNPTLSISPSLSPNPSGNPSNSNRIEGDVYIDSNKNKQFDTGEQKYQGAAMTITGGSGGSTNTNSNGNFAFLNLASGTYNLTGKISGVLFGTGKVTFPAGSTNEVANLSFPLDPAWQTNPTPIIIEPTVITPTPTSPPDNGGSGGGDNGGGGFVHGTPTPTPDQYYNCIPDPSCTKSGKSIQLCPLKCTPQ
jgi:subtilisin family serine protease